MKTVWFTCNAVQNVSKTIRLINMFIKLIIIPGQYLWCCHHDTSHYESSPDSSDECRAVLALSQLTWTEFACSLL